MQNVLYAGIKPNVTDGYDNIAWTDFAISGQAEEGVMEHFIDSLFIIRLY